MYTPAAFSTPSRQADTFSQELIALARERQGQNPTLGLPDVLVAMELAKVALLAESGVTMTRSRALVVGAVVLLAVIAAFVFVANS